MHLKNTSKYALKNIRNMNILTCAYYDDHNKRSQDLNRLFSLINYYHSLHDPIETTVRKRGTAFIIPYIAIFDLQVVKFK